MATVVDPKTKIDWNQNTSRARFPWDEWMDGQIYEAVEGKDFHSPPNSFTAQLRKKAEVAEKKVKYSIQNTEKPVLVIFQFEK